MINGGGCQGKTETICEIIASFEDEWLALYAQNPDAVMGTPDQHAPVAYVRTPVKATPISTCQRILDFYGEDYKGARAIPGPGRRPDRIGNRRAQRSTRPSEPAGRDPDRGQDDLRAHDPAHDRPG